MNDKQRTLLHNLLSTLQRNGADVDTKERVIYIPYPHKAFVYNQALRLSREFGYNIKIEID